MAQPSYNLHGMSLNYVGPNNVMHITNEATGETLVANTSKMHTPDRVTCLEVGSEFNKKEFKEVKAEQQQIRKEFKEMHAEINEMYAKFYGNSSISTHPNSNEIVENDEGFFKTFKNVLINTTTAFRDFFFNAYTTVKSWFCKNKID
jgi:hypothetical protein